MKAMLIISPRSYVTAAFDLLFPVLAESVVEWLEDLRINDWWEYFIYKPRVSIFGETELMDREKHSGNPFPKKGNIDDLKEHFDEYYLNKLINKDRVVYVDNKKFFYPKLNPISMHHNEVSQLLLDLEEYRNDWAHRGKRAPKGESSDIEEKAWADLAIKKIRDIADYLDKPDVEKRISILLFKMKCDWIDDSTELPSHTELLDWLYNNVVGYVLAPNSPVNEDVKARVEISFDNIKKFAEASLDRSASRYVIDYYWNAIRGKTDVYDEINKHGKIKTFEDVVEEFTKYCYKE